MNELIEKIIERLEEEKERHKSFFRYAQTLAESEIIGLNAAISIVKELTEEHKSVFQEQYEKGYADGWHDCSSIIQQPSPYQPKGE